MCELMGGPERLGPRELQDLCLAFGDLAESHPEAVAFTARKIAGVFAARADRADVERRAARAELLELLHTQRVAPPAAAAL